MLLLAQLGGGEIVTPKTTRMGAELNACQTEAAFSPKGDAEKILLERIGGAQKSIYVAMFAFTNRDLANALIAAHTRGVGVSVKLDQSQSRDKPQKAVIDKLKAAHIPVEISVLKALMHNKFSVIDESIVTVGSYNWTLTAEKTNRENMLVLTCQWLAKLYLADWNKIR